MKDLWARLVDFWDALDQIVLPAGPTLAVSVSVLLVLLYIGHRQQNPPEGPARVWLADQVAFLAKAGLHLRPGLGVEDLLRAFPAGAYRAQPELILAQMGGIFDDNGSWQEFSDQVTHFDYECIDDIDCYDTAVFTPLTALLPPDVPRALRITPGPELSWRIGDATRTIRPRIDDDWADDQVVQHLLTDIAAALPQRMALAKIEDGQAITLCVLARAAVPQVKKTIARDMEIWGG